MKGIKGILVASITILLFTSCTSLGRKAKPYYYFQGMAKPNTIVMTVDAKAENALVVSAFKGMEEFTKRADRISVSLTPNGDEYPLQTKDLSIYGVVQGDYPKFLINTGMMYSSALTRKENSDGLSWFEQKDSDLSFSVAKNDTFLFSNGSYATAYDAMKQEVPYIDATTASMMVNTAIAVYALEPETFFDFGLGLPVSAIKQMKSILLLIGKQEDSHTLDAYITMDSAKLAQTLSQMVRTGYLARLKKDKVPYKIADLMKMFLIQDDLFTIKGMKLSEEQMDMLKQSITGFVI
ncbi:hypothetical protein [uncultured Sphaerochaeta sp.]|uniref:hypothetical protein n=1 Tax=uncultured Sphaerochaeta sp. TaxID=886478 RepID=UPI002A0A9D64|nr:hypothetical protein [uncultured Sphaerochaeta sp.]